MVETLNEFGEEDRLDVDNEFLELLVACLGMLLQCCNACLYIFCQQKQGKESSTMSKIIYYTY